MINNNNTELRIRVLTLLIFVMLGLYTFRLFSIQIIQGDQFRKQSKNISQQSKRIPAQRGEIYDRNANVPMVLNIQSFAVDITPGEVPFERFDTIITSLSNILQVPIANLQKKVPNEIKRSFQTIEIQSNVAYETIVKIAESIDELPGVSWHSKPIRNYIETDSFSHIIGYVGDITKEELKSFYNKGYTTNSLIGKAGIEKQYDEQLRGKEGASYRTVDVKGRYIENTVWVKPPQMGNNIILTIDRKIQKLAEQALGERIGSAVVLKAKTGEVLAMVSYPFYDQNIFIKQNSGQLYSSLLNDERKPLLNRAVNASYPPASTFKIIMSTAILNEKAFQIDKKVRCLGEINYGDRIFRCHIRKPGHGYLDLKHALAQSCDIYYWTVCRDFLGIDKMYDYAQRFGFSKTTQIDLPSQAEGMVPSPKWKERRFHEKWLNGDTMNMAIGQGYTLVTPLHVANMVAMVVNNGTIYKPHLLKEIRDSETNEVILERTPEVLQTSNISSTIFSTVRAHMRFVVDQGSPRYPMKNKIVKLAGKTGTAEVGKSDGWHSWMVAYGPYDAPADDAIIVAVIVEATNKWEWWAPYATNIIFQGMFGEQTYDEAVDTLGFRNLPGIRNRQE